MESTSSKDPMESSSTKPNKKSMSAIVVRRVMRPVDKFLENEKQEKFRDALIKKVRNIRESNKSMMEDINTLNCKLEELKMQVDSKNDQKAFVNREEIILVVQSMPEFQNRNEKAAITKEDIITWIEESKQTFSAEIVDIKIELIDAVKQEFSVRQVDEFMVAANQQFVDLNKYNQEMRMIILHGSTSTETLERYSNAVQKLEAAEKRIDVPSCIQKFNEFEQVILPRLNNVREEIVEAIRRSQNEQFETFERKMKEIQENALDEEKRRTEEHTKQFDEAFGDHAVIKIEVLDVSKRLTNIRNSLNERMIEKVSKSEFKQWQIDLETRLMETIEKQLTLNHLSQMANINAYFKQQGAENKKYVSSLFDSLQKHIMKIEKEQHNFPKWTDMHEQITKSFVSLLTSMRNPNVPAPPSLPPLSDLPG
ncbi:unnamed protein product [Caenorhabditis angaria]|uniref:Uncharacterized protein n=1 Tax=Caenorhabditis angaria TaxID=860376 RepID=A0A9P1J5M8_9PELO|nr:unnamed protein product [Caenorhabditis angaria]